MDMDRYRRINRRFLWTIGALLLVSFAAMVAAFVTTAVEFLR